MPTQIITMLQLSTWNLPFGFAGTFAFSSVACIQGYQCVSHDNGATWTKRTFLEMIKVHARASLYLDNFIMTLYFSNLLLLTLNYMHLQWGYLFSIGAGCNCFGKTIWIKILFVWSKVDPIFYIYRQSVTNLINNIKNKNTGKWLKITERACSWGQMIH